MGIICAYNDIKLVNLNNLLPLFYYSTLMYNQNKNNKNHVFDSRNSERLSLRAQHKNTQKIQQLFD